MYVLWSRAARAKTTCKCTSCLHSIASTSRRLTATTPRPKLRLGDLFTACLSSTLASAAVIDASFKDQRRQQWDLAIAEVKASIPEPKDQECIGKSTSGEVPPSESDPEGDTWHIESQWPARYELSRAVLGGAALKTMLAGQLRVSFPDNIEAFSRSRDLELQRDRDDGDNSGPVSIGEEGDGPHTQNSFSAPAPCSAPESQSPSEEIKRCGNLSAVGPVNILMPPSSFPNSETHQKEHKISQDLERESAIKNRGFAPVVFNPQGIASNNSLGVVTGSEESHQFNRAAAIVEVKKTQQNHQVNSYSMEHTAVDGTSAALGGIGLTGDETPQVKETLLPTAKSAEPKPCTLEGKSPEEPVVWGSLATNLPWLEKMWYDEPIPDAWNPKDYASFVHREPRTELHLRYAEQNCEILVDGLLLEITSRDPDELFPYGDHVQVEVMAQRIMAMKSEFSRLPTFSWPDDETVINERALLHASFQTLFAKAQRKELSSKLLVLKICYNLLITKSPPSIETHDILLECFTKLKLHNIGQLVVDYFFTFSRFKPTTKSVVLWIEHYREKRDPEGFRDIRRRMRAGRGDLRLRRRQLAMLAEDPETAEWAVDNPTNFHRGALSEQVDRNTEIFDAEIRAALELDGPELAILYILAAFRLGRQVLGTTFLRVIVRCLKTKVWYESGSLLKGFFRIWNPDQPSLVLNTSLFQVQWALRRLMEITVPHMKWLAGRPIDPNAIKALVDHLQIEEVQGSVERSASLLKSLQEISSIKVADTDTTLEDKLDKSLALLNDARQFETSILDQESNSLILSPMTRLIGIEKTVQASEDEIVKMKDEFTAILYDTCTSSMQSQYLEEQKQFNISKVSDKMEFMLRLIRMNNWRRNAELMLDSQMEWIRYQQAWLTGVVLDMIAVISPDKYYQFLQSKDTTHPSKLLHNAIKCVHAIPEMPFCSLDDSQASFTILDPSRLVTQEVRSPPVNL